VVGLDDNENTPFFGENAVSFFDPGCPRKDVGLGCGGADWSEFAKAFLEDASALSIPAEFAEPGTFPTCSL